MYYFKFILLILIRINFIVQPNMKKLFSLTFFSFINIFSEPNVT